MYIYVSTFRTSRSANVEVKIRIFRSEEFVINTSRKTAYTRFLLQKVTEDNLTVFLNCFSQLLNVSNPIQNPFASKSI